MDNAHQLLALQFPGLNLPNETIDGVLQAIDAAGLELVEQTGGAPTESIGPTASVRYRVTGMPRTYLVGVSLGTNGWLAWLETHGKDGAVSKTTSQLIGAAGDLVAS